MNHLSKLSSFVEMDQVWPLVVLVLIFVGLLKFVELRMARKSKGIEYFPYEAIPNLCSAAELKFLSVLEEVIDSQKYKVFAKVRLADIIKVEKLRNRRSHTSAFNRISSKHIDFVICKRDDTSIVVVVELDDASHRAKSRQKRDLFVDKSLQVAGVRFIRFRCQRAYDLGEVRERLQML